jgi:hypothetical protein
VRVKDIKYDNITETVANTTKMKAPISSAKIFLVLITSYSSSFQQFNIIRKFISTRIYFYEDSAECDDYLIFTTQRKASNLALRLQPLLKE